MITCHDGCNGCKHLYDPEDAYPCSVCKGNYEFTDKRHFSFADRFEEAEPDNGQKEESKDDAVNHPSHYTQGGIECIDAMKAAFGPEELSVYSKIAAFKYIWRSEYKNGVEDMKKAVWYLNKYIELKGEANE